jgi:cobalamin biosynthesis Mg chelatase CobN
MGIRALFLVACILAISGLDAAAVERINPHDVLNQTRRDLNAFDKRMERDKAEQQKQEKEAEAKRKQDEAERQKAEKAEKALQEAQRKREAAEQQKQAREDKEREARQKQEEAERPNREQAEQAQQEAQRKREAAAAEAAKGASLSSPTTTPSRPSTGRAGSEFEEDPTVTASVHPAGPHHLPAFFTAPGETDVLMVGVAVFLVIAVVIVGILFLRLHTLPERIAHKSHKLQFEIVAVLGLLALFTHMHIFWVAGLLLALIDLPDFGVFNRMAGSLEKIARIPPGQREDEVDDESVAAATPMEGAPEIPPTIAPSRIIKERVHA